ncbi:protein DEHYDRATION-INDUCED 19 homolog 5 isoform X2 [Hevea brasiliensis]|uniref:protein DEHYDRATION-INDUCED 19 homolog 5 isoform X2 n=1 Tax=Hevea brasiliensis TaxID=3981 RepID=UPI0025F6544C|nr:protein DEHYDRATION-INDUCED 19 homolog 5 isoform X2 [Hevea brasiliensis]
MDVDFWPSRIYAKHLSAVQADRYNSDNNLAMDDSDGDEDSRAYFPCPFCYVDIEVHVLCSHLQDEHCFDLKNAVCPLCAANLGKDVIGHFTVNHASSLTVLFTCFRSSGRRRKSLKSGLWTGSSAMIGKELSSFLGSSTNGRANTNESAPDPLLSPFLGSGSHSHPQGSQEDESSNITAHLKRFGNGIPLIAYLMCSTETPSLDGGDEVDSEERRHRAAFVQELISSTIF